MGCVFLIGALCAYAYNRNMIVVSRACRRPSGTTCFGHMQTLPIKYFDTHAHGDVMSVYTNDVDTLRQMFAQSIPQIINSSMTILVTFLGIAVHQRVSDGGGAGVRIPWLCSSPVSSRAAAAGTFWPSSGPWAL